MATGIRITIEEILIGSHTDRWRAQISIPAGPPYREIRLVENDDLEDLLADIAEQIITVPADDTAEEEVSP